MFRASLRIPILLMALLTGGAASALTETSVCGQVAIGSSEVVSYNPMGYGVLTIRSEPEGALFATTQEPKETGAVIETAELNPSTSTFVYWTVNGVVQRDAQGVALRQVSLAMSAKDMEIVAVAESDDVRRMKLFWYGNDAVGETSDTDGDGRTLVEEKAMGTIPIYQDTSVSGNVACGTSEIISYNVNVVRTCTIRSEPEDALFATSVAQLEEGELIETVEFNPATSSFAYWTVNGVAQRDAQGVALRQLSLTMPAKDVEIIAVAESDAVRRTKLFWYGNGAVGDTSDTDDDGMTLVEEAANGTIPVYRDESLVGGVARSMSESVTIDMEGLFATVTFDAAGGVCGESSREVAKGQCVGELPEPSLDDYDFLGWFTAASGGEQVSSETVVTADVTWYAHWKVSTVTPTPTPTPDPTPTPTPDPTPTPTPTTGYAVTLDANGGTCATVKIEVEEGATAGTLPSATKEGCAFLGWFTAAVGGEQVSSETVVTADVTWYARWQASAYSIMYVGSKGGANPNPATYTIEDAVTFAALPDVAGYAFAGWSPSGIAKGSTGDRTVTAQYSPVAYVISYVDTKGAANPNPATYTIEDAVTFAALPDVDGWRFVGWSPASIAKGNVGIVTVVANWEQVAPPVVIDDDNPMDAGIANDYDGVIVDADGLPMGYISVKAAKATGKGEASSSKVTATIQMAGEAKKVTVKANVLVSEATMTQAASDGRVLDLTFSRNGIWGTFDGYEVKGTRNRFASKAKSDKGTEAKAAAEAACALHKGNYILAFEDEDGWNGLSVSVMAKGKVKVSGKLANGTSVATTSQLIVGSDYSVIPVVYTKGATSLSFNVYFPNDGSDASVFGYWDAVVSRVGNIGSGLALRLGDSFYDLYDGVELLDFLPDGVSVEPSGTKWVVADGAKKGGKIVIDKDTGEAYDKNESANPSGLKLTYAAKTGTFKGTFKVYFLANGKVKSETATVTGFVANGRGYGTVTVKKRGTAGISIE